jgi:hypothetical protein
MIHSSSLQIKQVGMLRLNIVSSKRVGSGGRIRGVALGIQGVYVIQIQSCHLRDVTNDSIVEEE